MPKRFWVYIMASKPWGTLYIGVTSDLEARVYQQREGLIEGFTKKYGVKMLVYFEEQGLWPMPSGARSASRNGRASGRSISSRTDNPDWKDLAERWHPENPTPEQIENWVARTSRAMTV